MVRNFSGFCRTNGRDKTFIVIRICGLALLNRFQILMCQSGCLIQLSLPDKAEVFFVLEREGNIKSLVDIVVFRFAFWSCLVLYFDSVLLFVVKQFAIVGGMLPLLQGFGFRFFYVVQ